MKYKVIIVLALLCSSLYSNIGVNAKVGYGSARAEGHSEGVLCYGTEIVYFSNMTLCGSVGFDAWHWSEDEGGYSASLNNSSIILSLGAAFPKRKPIASIRGGFGLVTWWKMSFEGGGLSGSETERMAFKDIFGVFDIYAPISRNFDIVFQAKYVHQTLNIEELGYTYSQGWDTFSGKTGFQVNF